jgi:hypothetical protein
LVPFTVTAAFKQVDVVLVLDSTASMVGLLYEFDLGVADFLENTGRAGEAPQLGFATYADYACADYGFLGYDLPFALHHQVSSDYDSVLDSIAAASDQSGGDLPESSFEAIYQAMTGRGYDQDCDGVYDADTDVLPFVASGDDAFAGAEVGTYDASIEGGGTGGGMGFRADALPVVVYVTDAELRDAGDPLYGTPGGCPADAGHDAVIERAAEMGAMFIGMTTMTEAPLAQMNDLADATASLADLDGDGDADDRLVASILPVGALVGDPLTDLYRLAVVDRTFAEVTFEVASDPGGVVLGFAPPSFTAVPAGTELSTVMTLAGSFAEPGPDTVDVEIVLYGDGYLLERQVFTVLPLAP